jgi:tetratricopeptide (TPR) repeat protein
MEGINPTGRRAPKPRRAAVTPGLKIVFHIVLGLTALLGANSIYLLAVTILEQTTNGTFQNYFYQYMFLAHLVVGLILLLPFIAFAAVHLRNGRDYPNRGAIRLGYLLLAASILLLASGILLMRVEGLELRDPRLRSITYWAHILTPIAVVWLYLLHRLSGRRIRWKTGIRWGAVSAVLIAVMAYLHLQDPRLWTRVSPRDGDRYFEPSLARTAHGGFIPAETLMLDSYCQECHEDSYEGWFHSSHHFASFNNPAYLFSIKETRAVALERDGDVKASRWCAGCHDPVPFFSGAFDDPEFDVQKHPTSQAGITCTACHSITQVNSTRGNGDYVIEEPLHYPFTFSTNRVLQFVNRQLVKAKPEFHKKTFLKPVHKTSEYCSSCHKVHIPKELNHYKEFLRGQNHYDSWLLSGVSGHGARSFYYPQTAQTNCAGCHMPLQASADFGATYLNPTNTTTRYIHDHLFPSANTAIPYLRGDTNTVERHRKYLEGSLRVDIFGIREEGTIDGNLNAPLRPEIPSLTPGKTYLLEVVIRTLRLGHHFTQGTVDSNEVWLQTQLQDSIRTIGQSGSLDNFGEVDPWSHFVNVYMLDRHGNRIDRRNPQDIFTPLYDHQMPPGTGQVVHYRFQVPENQTEPLQVSVNLKYRKFDTLYAQYFLGQDYAKGQPYQVTNTLPIVTIASDTLTFPVAASNTQLPQPPPSTIATWERWNDYGIGLLLKGEKGSDKGQLRQAEQAFLEVEKLGRADGPLNLARVYLKEGRLDDAVTALQRASSFDPPAPRWTVAWLNGLANKQNGYLDQAIQEFKSIIQDSYPELQQRKFDFSLDVIVLNELGQTLFERAKMDRLKPAQQNARLQEAVDTFNRSLTIDPENLAAHYNLALLHEQLGQTQLAAEHRQLHERYRPDDNAKELAVTTARRQNPPADHAAQAIVIYDLQREQ